MFRIVNVSLILICVLFAGCSSKTLTRGKAKEVIEQSDRYKPQKFHIDLTPQELQALWSAGYLQVRSVFFVNHLEVAPKGKRF